MAAEREQPSPPDLATALRACIEAMPCERYVGTDCPRWLKNSPPPWCRACRARVDAQAALAAHEARRQSVGPERERILRDLEAATLEVMREAGAEVKGEH